MKSASFVLPPSLEIISGPPPDGPRLAFGNDLQSQRTLVPPRSLVPLGHEQLDVINLLDFEHGGIS